MAPWHAKSLSGKGGKNGSYCLILRDPTKAFLFLLLKHPGCFEATGCIQYQIRENPN